MPLSVEGNHITIESDIRRHWRVSFHPDLLQARPDTTPDLFGTIGEDRRRAMIVDGTVLEHYGARLSQLCWRYGFKPHWIEARASEDNKVIEQVVRIAMEVDTLQLDRRSQPLIAIGGGVVTDVVGMLGGIYKRGFPVIRIPTTLLGLADAGIAAKTGVNHAGKKNLLGTYDPPAQTWLDLAFVATQNMRHVSNGLAEIAKAAIMGSRALWHLLQTHGPELLEAKMQPAIGWHVLRHAVLVMLTELGDNMREARLDRTMDFGHALAPTWEMQGTGYLHGEWVAVDMALFLAISTRRGLLAQWQFDQIYGVLRSLGLLPWHPLLHRDDLLTEGLAETTRHRGGQQRLWLLHGVGQPEMVNDVTVDELRNARDMLGRLAEWQS